MLQYFNRHTNFGSKKYDETGRSQFMFFQRFIYIDDQEMCQLTRIGLKPLFVHLLPKRQIYLNPKN